MADRYFYVPAIGLWIIVADQIARFLPSDILTRKRALGIIALILLILGGLTVRRNTEWRSDIVLFSGLVEQYPDQAFVHHNLGCAYLDKAGDLDAAEREFNRAFELDPFFPRLRTQMGYIRLLKGDYEGALHHYNEAVRQNPFDAEALLNRAIALDKLGRYEDAVSNYQRFLAAPGNELPQARSQAEARLYELSR
jgi:tetratricopeptide (TPR) repeat protein